jgi:hypothetical protein
LILHSEVEDIVRQAVCTELEKRLVKTLQDSTTPQKCGMSRYPSTSLQKPTGLVAIRKCAVRIRSSFAPNSGMLASASDGCGLNFGRKAQRVAWLLCVTQRQRAGFQSQKSWEAIGLLNIGGCNPDTMNVPSSGQCGELTTCLLSTSS